MKIVEYRFEIDGVCYAWMNRRPDYCDRGRFDAHVEGVWISDADFWPRYYFDVNIAKKELETYLNAKKIDITNGVWVELSREEAEKDTPLFARRSPSGEILPPEKIEWKSSISVSFPPGQEELKDLFLDRLNEEINKIGGRMRVVCDDEDEYEAVEYLEVGVFVCKKGNLYLKDTYSENIEPHSVEWVTSIEEATLFDDADYAIECGELADEGISTTATE